MAVGRRTNYLWGNEWTCSLHSGNCTYYLKLRENNVAFRVALDWAVSDTALVYGSISRGFKSGAFPVLAANIETQLDPVVQEEVLAYEIGTKWSVADSLQLNAAMYYYDYKDKQLFSNVPDPIFNVLERLVNIPESEVFGVEADATWVAGDMTTLRLGLSYTDSEVKEYSGFDEFGNSADFAGSPFQYTPELQANILVAQGFSISDSLEAWLFLDAQYSDEAQADLAGAPELAVDSYTVVGLRASLVSLNDTWTASLWSKNITNEYYWTSVDSETDTTFRFAGMPRTYGVEFEYKF